MIYERNPDPEVDVQKARARLDLHLRWYVELERRHFTKVIEPLLYKDEDEWTADDVREYGMWDAHMREREEEAALVEAAGK